MIEKNIPTNKMEMLVFSSQYLEFWKDKLILVSLFTNAVFIINMTEYHIEKVIRLPYSDQKRNLYRFFTVYKDDLILVPYAAKKFLKINLYSGEIKKIDRLVKETEGNVDVKFLFGIKRENFLWCVRDEGTKLVCLNLERFCVEKIRIPEGTFNGIRWSDTYIIVNDSILIPSLNFNAVLEMNDLKDIFKVHVLNKPIEKKGFLDIACLDGKVHLYDDNGLEYIWNLVDDSLKCLDIEKQFLSRQSIMCGDVFLRIALYDNSIYKYTKDKRIHRISVSDQKVKLREKMVHFHAGRVEGENLYIQSRYGYLFRMDIKTLEIEEICIKYENDVETGEEIIQEMLETKIIGEGEIGTVEQYIQWVNSGYGCINPENSAQVGARIHRQLTFEN